MTPEHVLQFCPRLQRSNKAAVTPWSNVLCKNSCGATTFSRRHPNRRTDHVRQNPAGKRRMRTMKEPSGNLTTLIDFRPGGTDSNSTQEKGPAGRTKRQWPCLATEIALLWKRHPRYLGGYNGKKARPHCKHVTP